VSDANDCLTVDTVTVNPFGCQLQIEIDSTQIDSLLCFGDANGRIQIQTSGQVDTVFYEWNTGDSTASIENLVAGTYTLIVSDSASCRDTLAIVLPEPPQLQADPIATPETGFNANDGTIAANPSGGTPPYAYLWSTGATDSIITNLVPGIYSLTLTDANSCSVSTRARVASFGCGLVIADISGRDLLCNGDQSGLVQVTPTGGLPPYSYLWSNGAQTDLQTGLSAGTYVVTVSDVTGCLAIDSVQISQPDPLLANLGTTDESFPTANDGSAMVMPSGGTPPYNIFWSTGATGTSISGLSPGSYSVTIFDANDCREEERFLRDAGDFGNCDFDAEAIVRNIRCAGGNDGLIQISVNGTFPPFRFQWNTGATGDVLMGLAAGTYVVSITDQQNCVDTLQLTLLDPPMLLANASATDETSPGANDGTATTAASGGTPPYNVLWSTGATSTAINGLTPGLYTVTVTDGNNCTVSEEVEVRAAGQGNCTLEIFETSQSNVSCFGGSDGRATAFVRGGTPPLQYRWSNGGNMAAINALQAGIYGVTVNDGAGCLDSAELEILQPDELLLNLSSTNESQPNAADGSASVAPSGGTPPYDILWSTGATSTAINGLTPGIYAVTITDANDCTVSEEVEIQAAG
ncbi:MAG: SprB repeat-containing protein, partial [Bacteroidota bacterium]